jgi:superfamily I DNA/RNA helicase
MPWMISEDQLDDIQTQIATQSLDTSLVISGCAGSGKTILALHRAAQISELSESFFVIVYTKVLRKFIEDGIRELDLNPDRIVHYHHWKKIENKAVKYLIIDEAQDFTENKIDKMFNSYSGSIILFGDRAQTLYDNSMPWNQIIGKKNDLSSQNLMKNYRFPKKIARVAQYLQAEDLGKIYVDRCVNEGDQKPRLYEFSDAKEQIDYIVEQISSKELTDVGILLPNNEQVQELYLLLEKYDIDCEARYKKDGGWDEVNTLDFSTNNPKLMTYHSSKGCQFNDVFLPWCEDDEIDDFYRKPLYVAFSRAINNVHVLYSYKLPHYFDIVPSDLYLTLDDEEEADF